MLNYIKWLKKMTKQIKEIINKLPISPLKKQVFNFVWYLKDILVILILIFFLFATFIDGKTKFEIGNYIFAISFYQKKTVELIDHD